MALDNLYLERTRKTPPKSPERKADGEGLYILTEPNGRMYWRFDYRLQGVRRTLALGTYPAIGLAKARVDHQAARALVKAGTDPVQIKQAERVPTFAAVAAQWVALINKKPRSPKTMDRDNRMVGYLNGAFGTVPIDQVEPRHLVALLDTFEKANSFETRSRLQAAAINIGGYAHGGGLIKQNPFLGIPYGSRFTAPRNVARPAIVEAAPFGELLRDIADYKARKGGLVRIALDLVALTFVRPGTVINAEWADIDLDAAVWTVPFSKLKQRTFREGVREMKGKPHFVPLARQAVKLLRELNGMSGHGRYLFPGTPGRRGRIVGTMSSNALETALHAMGYRDRHVPHGFRSSASTLLNAERIIVGDNEVPRFAAQAIEFQLEHVDASVAGIYNRDERLRERTVMMQFWADKIDELRTNKKQKQAKFKAVA